MGSLAMKRVKLAIASLVALVAVLVSGCSSAPATAYSVRLTAVSQDWRYDCVPASSSMFLQAFGVHATQDTLSRQMHTYTNQGTTGDDETRVLNSYLAPRFKAVYLSGQDASEMTGTLTAQLSAGYPVLLDVEDNLLPWTAGVDFGGKPAGHVILATGISGTTVSLFDPAQSHYHGGWHQISITALLAAMGGSGSITVAEPINSN